MAIPYNKESKRSHIIHSSGRYDQQRKGQWQAGPRMMEMFFATTNWTQNNSRKILGAAKTNGGYHKHNLPWMDGVSICFN